MAGEKRLELLSPESKSGVLTDWTTPQYKVVFMKIIVFITRGRISQMTNHHNLLDFVSVPSEYFRVPLRLGRTSGTRTRTGWILSPLPAAYWATVPFIQDTKT